MLNSEWRKSARSGNQGNCVEARCVDNEVEVRDSKNPDGPVLRFNAAEWVAFVGGVQDGDFDL